MPCMHPTARPSGPGMSMRVTVSVGNGSETGAAGEVQGVGELCRSTKPLAHVGQVLGDGMAHRSCRGGYED